MWAALDAGWGGLWPLGGHGGSVSRGRFFSTRTTPNTTLLSTTSFFLIYNNLFHRHHVGCTRPQRRTMDNHGLTDSRGLRGVCKDLEGIPIGSEHVGGEHDREVHWGHLVLVRLGSNLVQEIHQISQKFLMQRRQFVDQLR